MSRVRIRNTNTRTLFSKINRSLIFCPIPGTEQIIFLFCVFIALITSPIENLFNMPMPIWDPTPLILKISIKKFFCSLDVKPNNKSESSFLICFNQRVIFLLDIWFVFNLRKKDSSICTSYPNPWQFIKMKNFWLVCHD